MAKKIKAGLVLFIFVVIFLPLLQQEFSIVPGIIPAGDHRKELYQEFSWRNWWNGSFWDIRGRYLNDAVGFRTEFVKINNQLDYSLFEKSKSQSLVIGANHCLFYKEFVLPYYGMGYLGRAAIIEKLRKLKAIQDTLGRLGKSLLFIQAPCKVSYYPEYVPEEFKTLHRGPNNYDVFTGLADSMGINHIDFNAWFISMKGKSRELLFTRESIHWSMYGALIAADSLVKYLERIRHIRMPHPHWDKIEHTRKAKYMDDDITQAMGLLLPVSNDVYGYPEVTYTSDSTMTRPRAIYIGDSYLFNWIHGRVMDNEHINWQLWYYFREIWDRYSQEEGAQHKQIAGYNWVHEINNTDCVILMFTSANDYHLGDTFIERAYEHYFPEGKHSKQFSANWN